jgi:arginyl-tRNA synthetase
MSTLPLVPGTDASRCVLDLFRTAIAKRVSDTIRQLTLEQVYSGVDYGKKGVDFTVALPRFRLKENVENLGAQIVQNVRHALLYI